MGEKFAMSRTIGSIVTLVRPKFLFSEIGSLYIENGFNI